MVFFLSALFVFMSTVAFLPVKVIKIPNSKKIDFIIPKGMMLKSCFQGILLYYSLYSQSMQGMGELLPGKIHYTQTLLLTSLCVTNAVHVLPIVCMLQVKKKLKVFKCISEISLILHKDTFHSPRRRFISYITLFYACYTLGSYGYCLKEEYVMKVMYLNDCLKFVLICAIVEFFEVVSDIDDCFHYLNTILPATFDRWFSLQITTQNSWMNFSNASQTSDIELRDVFELHRQLCCIVEKINVTYGYQNFVIVVFIFLQLIYCPLEMLAMPSYYHTWPVLAHCINHNLIYLLVLYVLVRPCTHTATEAKRTVAILSKLMGKAVSEAEFKELEMYCRQLFLRKVQFSACGFFTLEIPLILSMLSVVTTYFTIIVQFQMSDKKSLSTNETLSQNITLEP